MSIELRGSVGRRSDNHEPDVRKLQKALNDVIITPQLVLDGDCGPKTIRRIERLQRGFTTSPTGRVEPGDRTLRKLNASVPALSEDWSGDSQKWSQERKLASLEARTRPKVERVIAVLADGSFRPKIVYAWRSVAVQQELVAAGHSRVRFSFHNAQKKNGTPNAYAADIIDRRWAWGEKAGKNGFWDALGAAARAEGLVWGGNWRRFPDVAHVQLLANSKLAEARRESGLA